MGERVARRERVLVVGWDAADWVRIRALMRAGRMPALTGLIERGVSGGVMGVEPLVPVMGWVSLATGVMPSRHGVWGPVVADEELSGEVREVGGRDRKVGAIWDAVGGAGRRAVVVGWPGVEPAEKVNGVCVTRRFLGAGEGEGGVVFPASARAELETLRVEAGGVPREAVEVMVGREASSVQRGAVAAMLAEAWNTQAVAEWGLKRGDWDLACVFQPGIGQASRVFWESRGVVDEMLVHQDALLEGLIAAAGEGVTVVVVSVHGFKERVRGGAGPRTMEELEGWHRREGVFVMAGEGVRRDELVEGARVVDVMPTVLAGMGVAIPRGVEGRVLRELFEGEIEVAWGEEVGKSEAMDVGGAVERRVGAESYLMESGYSLPGEESERKLLEGVEGQNRFNLARSLLFEGKTEESVGILEGLVKRWPGRMGFQRALFDAYAAEGRVEEMERLIGEVWGMGYRGPLVKLGQAVVALGRRDARRAVELLKELEGMGGEVPEIGVYLGRAYERLGMWWEALGAFEAVVAADVTNAGGWIGVARACVALREDAGKAVDAGLRAVALRGEGADGHYVLGLALVRAGRLREAAVALERCRGLRPGLVAVYRRLEGVYREMGDLARAREVERARHEVMMRKRVRAGGLVK